MTIQTTAWRAEDYPVDFWTREERIRGAAAFCAGDQPVRLQDHLYSYDADVSPELREFGQRTMALAFLGWLMRSQADLTARPVKVAAMEGARA